MMMKTGEVIDVVYVSHFFSFSRSSFSLSSFPCGERTCKSMYSIRENSRRRRFGARLFLVSRYRSNARALIVPNAFY